MLKKKKELLVLGWREWVTLPDLDIVSIKAKIDTGARTSALHAFKVEPFCQRGKDRVRFAIHPVQRRADKVQVCEADVVDCRMITDSGGHREKRFVICTQLRIADMEYPIEITLTDRDTMNFRLLLGRTSLAKKFIVNPSVSYRTGRPPRGSKR